MNELGVTERETIIGLPRLGWSTRRIERETGHRRETIARYGREAGVLTSKPATAVEVSKWPPTQKRPPPAKVASDRKAATVGEVATELKPHTAGEVPTDSGRSRSACEPHRAFIEAEFVKGRNAVAIYQDLVEHHGYSGAYNAVKRFVRQLRVDEPKLSCRFETAPGQ